MTPSDDTRSSTPAFDPDAVRDKYAEERAKRMTEDRGVLYDLRADERFAEYTKDPFTPFVERDAVAEEVDVAIIGAGMSGVTVGAKLRDQGLRKVVLIDKAGGIGGTWYWNRYPGVMCDVESYIYLPMLEEMNYVPTTRYAFGDEIRRHLDADRDEVRPRRRRARSTPGSRRARGTRSRRAGSSAPTAATRCGPAT